MKFSVLGLLMSLLFVFACQQNGDNSTPNKETTTTVAQPFDGSFKPLTEAQLPEAAQLEGTLEKALNFEDQKGQNTFTVYRNGPIPEPNSEDAMAANLQLALFQNDGQSPVWAYSLAEADCPFDLWVGLDSLTVTDLDEDGIAEIGMVLTHSCRSDVSPSNLQVIVLEEEKAYIIKGSQWLPLMGDMPEKEILAFSDIEDATAYAAEHDLPAIWGRYEVMGKAAGFPELFKDHAEQLWQDHMMERSFRSLNLGD